MSPTANLDSYPQNTYQGKEAVVFGYGSIGRRHVANLRFLGFKVSIVTSVNDLGDSGASRIESEAMDPGRFLLGIVANRADAHLSSAKICLKNRIPFLIEKPLAPSLDGVTELGRAVRDAGIWSQMAFVLRYHPCVKFMKHLLASEPLIGKILGSYTQMGSYMPDWRKNIIYQDSASAELGVVMDMAHEFDYLRRFFGPMVKVSSHATNLSGMQTSLDWADIIYQTMSHHGSLHLDFVDRSTTRQTRIVGGNGTLVMDLIGQRVLHLSGGESKCLFEASKQDRNTMYMDMLLDFLEKCRCGFDNADSEREWREGSYAVQAALAVLRSATEKREIDL